MLFRPAQLIVTLAGVVAMTAATWRAGASDISEVGEVMANEGFSMLPLRRGGDDQVEVGGRVLVNGVHGRFLIDTGAQVSVIDRRSVRRFKLTSEKTATRVYGALGGRGERLRAALAMSFVVGPADMRPFIFGVADLGPLNESRESDEGDFNGIIGIDVLRTYQFIVDYRGMRLFIRIDDPKNASRSNLSSTLRRQGYTEIPLETLYVYSDFEFRAKINDDRFRHAAGQRRVGHAARSPAGARRGPAGEKLRRQHRRRRRHAPTALRSPARRAFAPAISGPVPSRSASPTFRT